MKKQLLFLLMLMTSISFAQQYAFIDFGHGNTTTSGNWNNVVTTMQNQTGVIVNLIDSNGAATGVTLELTDAFDAINTNGTTSPNSALPFPASATRDSFFGATSAAFNGNITLTGGFTLTGLDPSKYYSFSVFSSRTGVSDNRETLYTVTGATIAAEGLNASNNTANTADILNIQSTASGDITFEAKPGPNNNNSFGFFYIGALQLIISDTPIGDTTPDPALTLTYPNGGHLWEVDKTVRVKWSSIAVTDMLIEFSSDNGANWSTIATAPASLQYYDMVVPNTISSSCLIRISGEGLTDTSDAAFETIPNEGLVYRIVILGSSTAAGVGPSDGNNAWATKYRNYLTEMDTRYDIVNLAVGGYATYNILPTGTPIPSGVSRSIDTQRNITKGIELVPGGVIINMPSNDAASGYPVADQLTNYNLISAVTTSEEVPLWVTTPQPRNFGSNTTNLNIQTQMVTETNMMFGDFAIDFWTGFPIANNNGILPQYDSGDGIHYNDAAHQIFYDRVIAKGIHLAVKERADALSVEDYVTADFKVYPNPVTTTATIKFTQTLSQEVTITLIDMLGKEIYRKTKTPVNNTMSFSRDQIESGFYIMRINSDNKIITKRILIN
ncbi:T9SS type A sorting domain-containing protein [Gelidibacter pelagius]|uniref:T9SS type A sorting domain-containing protein n=1 Tax=Gelidibacter pelagius TaxID=2819985 RepID=A0ABS3SS98_9FLAO|nr:T9SS type A sorting domain-containing protein [Gelidibacter pelagius]MBO3097778.1 T9SS type A sorting domain-containing protein [Gelidibacter pelagius]